MIIVGKSIFDDDITISYTSNIVPREGDTITVYGVDPEDVTNYCVVDVTHNVHKKEANQISASLRLTRMSP